MVRKQWLCGLAVSLGVTGLHGFSHAQQYYVPNSGLAPSSYPVGPGSLMYAPSPSMVGNGYPYYAQNPNGSSSAPQSPAAPVADICMSLTSMFLNNRR